jgi:hypothetical protein
MAVELETDPDIDVEIPFTPEPELEDDKKLVPIIELRKVRKEAETNRKALLEYKAKVKAQEESVRIAGLDEKSKLEERLKKSEADNKVLADKMNRVQVENAIISLAVGLGFTDSKDVIKLIDLSEAIDDQGNVDQEKLEVAVKKIADEKPYLRKSRASMELPLKPIPPGGLKPKLTDQNAIDQMKHQSMELIRQGKVAEATRLYNNVWEQTQGLRK